MSTHANKHGKGLLAAASVAAMALLAALAIGRNAEEVARMLEGIPCRGNTSCPDQLSKALKAYHD